ncbi:physarolisin II. Serine peptidase. MEROPS family S53 [Quadrisphaera granulorum]|uniref:Physarolisin II n=1 Tax=Quadrisphaera granulorum TaxID=317664 RepID=A0A316A0X8_9ACTN|nr:S53 family serine peptidase [Quadrisphaera granulorum]PWJ51182.1 physarolisin II [Quadrisphaera granulorum]SZE97832.1 physarolisin II. Serine peptidase. MEROPS family S53 [Quadrisphaera granulorum]
MRISELAPRRWTTRAAAVTAVLLTIALTGLSTGFVAGPAQAADRTAFPDAKPAWATAASDAGAAPADTSVEGYLALPLRDAAGARALAVAVSTPTSARYGQFVSAQQWISTYAPTQTTVDVVTALLRAYGMTVTAVPASRTYVVFRGPADKVNRLFGTSLRQYRVDGDTVTAPSSTPSLPSSVGALVSSVSLSGGALKARPGALSPGREKPASFARAGQAAPAQQVPCSDFWGQRSFTAPRAYGRTSFPTNICGYTAAQMRAVSGTVPGDGAGQTVAIVDAYASPTVVADSNKLFAAQGEPGISGLYSEIGVDRSTFTDQEACQGEEAWQGEQSLDVQAVHAVAPKARIVYSAGANCGAGLYIAVSRVLDTQAASVISNSWGIPEQYLVSADRAIYDYQGWQAAAQGIGLYASSGDDGDETINDIPKQVGFPAAHPFWTAVGGTSVGVDASGRIAVETGWGNARSVITGTAYDPAPPGDFYAGAGGGTGTIYREPDWQRGVVPDAISRGYRAVPDIANIADPYTGFLTGYTPILEDGSTATGEYEAYPTGGTSLASPMVAAQVAAVQGRIGARVGFASPAIYQLAKVAPSVVRDVKAPAGTLALASFSPSKQANVLVTLDRDSSLRTTNGWDAVTGLGVLPLDSWQRLAQR